MIITAGIYKGRKILAPNENITRPTLSKTRMGVFNSLYSILGEFEGKSFLDLFGGSGIMGIEALSRGFSKVTVCELNKTAASIIKKNYASLSITPDLYVCDSKKFVLSRNTFYDVVYIDPPYQSRIYEEILKGVNGVGINGVGVKGKIIVIEHDKNVKLEEYDVIKEKNYGGKIVTFISQSQV